MAITTVERKTLSVAEAAKVLGISRTYAYQQANAGTLPGCVKVGARMVVSVKQLNAYIDGEEA